MRLINIYRIKGSRCMKEHMEIVYRCHNCKKEYDPNELPDLEEFDEDGDWIYPCPECSKPVVWGFR
jgi:DNA-directed RNA polymerase subunit RPC12/RpoP